MPSRRRAADFLCLACGSLRGEPARSCDCGTDEASLPVLLVKPAGERQTLGRCAACSAATPAEIVYRFVTGQDAPVAVIGTSLYQDLAPSSDKELSGEVGEGRKMLRVLRLTTGRGPSLRPISKVAMAAASSAR